MKNIQIITHESKLNDSKVLMAGAYCRVSTDSKDQEESYEAQYNYYSSMFKNDENRKLYKVYGDQGVSGLRIKDRDGFLEMIDDAEKGLINEIYTRSFSRFGRNVHECLSYLRHLKAINVTVYFEKEKLNSKEDKTEIVLSFMSLLAQEESNSISISLSWAIDKASKNGKPFRKCCYGYYKKDNKWLIDEEKAERVRLVYKLYLDNSSISSILKELIKYEDIHGKTRNWTVSMLKTMLDNEAYGGLLIIYKSYTLDYLTRTVKRNEGEHLKYIIDNHHEPIIEKFIFDSVRMKRGLL